MRKRNESLAESIKRSQELIARKERISVLPSWSALMPWMIGILEGPGNRQVKTEIRKQLMHLARETDRRNGK